MKALISVVFGVRDQRVGWISEEEIPELPPIGMPVLINVAGNSGPVEGQVYRAWETDDDEPGGMLIYGGPVIPDETFQEGIEFAGWERLTSEALKVLSDAVDETPILAATHEVILFVGSPDSDLFRAYRRVLTPFDPALPLFGQRIRLLAVDGFAEDDEEEEVEVANLKEYNEEWQRYRAQEMERIERELNAESTNVDISEGIPAVTLYSALVRTGVGRVAFWTPELFGLQPEDLIAHDWDMLRIPEEFDPVAFRVAERIRLARDTTVTFEFSDSGAAQVKDWFMDHPLEVTDDQHRLIPPILVEHVRASKEFDDFASIIQTWKNDT